MTINPQNTIIIVALESELPAHLLPDWPVIYSGVGKVNASIAASIAIQQYQPDVILNYGTAGSLDHTLHGLIEIGEFIERDMDVEALGFAKGLTPFEDAITISFGHDGVRCGTGDQFVTSVPDLWTEVVDMEAYALAKCAKAYGSDFRSLKYISDMADDSAANDWQANQALGAEQFVNWLNTAKHGGDTRT
ncbi:MAG: 5'-methylthioadenosine nucleosidase [Alphaproteobacteria bacterium]|nr:5'-methylthioadenosine nucleosidase [Alphaproteobacteria bacterium]